MHWPRIIFRKSSAHHTATMNRLSQSHTQDVLVLGLLNSVPVVFLCSSRLVTLVLACPTNASRTRTQARGNSFQPSLPAVLGLLPLEEQKDSVPKSLCMSSTLRAKCTTNISCRSRFASGGGFSNYFKAPNYQKSFTSDYVASLNGMFDGLYNKGGRGYPDVAAQG